MATEGDPALQRRLLARALATKFPAFDAVTYADYDQLFTVLHSRTVAPFTLVLDEFPYLTKSDGSLASILQRYLDDRSAGRFSIVVCGSSQQMMHDTVLSGTAPLYGRADEIVNVRPLNAGWLRHALPALSDDDIIREYGVWGGVPRYWETRQRYTTLSETVIRTLFHSSGLYYDEAQRLLLDDLRDLAQPTTLLTTIAQGVHRPAEIGARLGKQSNDLHRPLNRLISLGYIIREVPFGTPVRNSKTVQYRLADPFLRFYYRFVVPNASVIGADAGESLWRQVAGELPRFVSWNWEQLCTRAVLHGLRGQDITRAGRWWGKLTSGKLAEVDVLATNHDKSRWVAIECKWGLPKNIQSIREELTAKVRQIPGYNGAPVDAFVATRTPPVAAEDGVIVPADVLQMLK